MRVGGYVWCVSPTPIIPESLGLKKISREINVFETVEDAHRWWPRMREMKVLELPRSPRWHHSSRSHFDILTNLEYHLLSCFGFTYPESYFSDWRRVRTCFLLPSSECLQISFTSCQALLLLPSWTFLWSFWRTHWTWAPAEVIVSESATVFTTLMLCLLPAPAREPQ